MATGTIKNIGGIEDFTSKVTFDVPEDVSLGNWTKLYKKDDVVYIQYQGWTGAVTGGTTLFTLPSGYRPNVNFAVPGASSAVNDANLVLRIRLNTNGTVVLMDNSTTGGRIYFTAS